MNSNFEFISALQYRNKALSREVESFKSGERYIQIQNEYRKTLRQLERRIAQLTYELSKAHSETVTVRKYWSEVMDDLDKEHKKEIEDLMREIRLLKERNLEVERQRDMAKDLLREKNQMYYTVAAELEEDCEKNRKLTAQINRDFENSSIPSSMKVRHKKITNNRERTGRKPGGQPGHAGHCRRRQIPTSEPILLAPPQEVMEDPYFKKTPKQSSNSWSTSA